MLEKIQQILNGEVDIPIEYIYYLVGLNIITVLVFLYAIYYTQKIMNQDDDEDDSDTGFLDENGNRVTRNDDSISGGTATTSSSSNDSLQAPKVYRRVRKGL